MQTRAKDILLIVWDRQTFLEQTCNKAGLPPNAWKDSNSQIFIFRAEIFTDHPPQ